MPKAKQPDDRAVPDIKRLWKKDVAEHDYDAAFAFLRIRVGEKRAKALIKGLRAAKHVQMRANDILRACQLPALEIDDPGTHRNMVRTIIGKPLSPVLVVSLVDGQARSLTAITAFPGSTESRPGSTFLAGSQWRTIAHAE